MTPYHAVTLTTGVRTLKSNRSAGPDNISPEFIKCGGPALLQWIFILMKRIWTFSQCDLPTTDRLDSLLPIPKKAGGTKVSCFRLICLLVSIYKVCYFSVPEGTRQSEGLCFLDWFHTWTLMRGQFMDLQTNRRTCN